jgi:HEAT repeat protein
LRVFYLFRARRRTKLCPVATRESVVKTLNELFDAERATRRLHDELADSKEHEILLDVLTDALGAATRETEDEEATLRLVRISALLGEIEGPRAVDCLIDVLASEHPEARSAAGEQLEEIAFDRFKEVARAVERALKRLPVGSPALPELPYVIAEVPEPGVAKLLGQFLSHQDPDAVAAAIETLVEMGDPAGIRLIQPLLDDPRTVELADEGDETSEVTLGELAAEALTLLQGEDDEPEPGKGSPGRGDGSA